MKKNGFIILIVDDDLANCTLLHEYFISINIECVEVENGLDAIEMIKKEPLIKLVLMDIKMPGMNGIECMKEIRGIRNDLPVVAVTAILEAHRKKSYLQEGFDGYISKPIDIENLQYVVEKFIL